MDISPREQSLLRAMAKVRAEGASKKCDVALRYALQETGEWNESAEFALCNSGDEDTLVWQFYTTLRKLIQQSPFADGRGDLELPAGPCYTECWITDAGLAELARWNTPPT